MEQENVQYDWKEAGAIMTYVVRCSVFLHAPLFDPGSACSPHNDEISACLLELVVYAMMKARL